MLIKEQLNQISKDFQIDTFSVFREYLQILFLNYLFQEKKSEKVFFKGGTCLHLLYGSPRFSEDLDFSTTLSEKTLKTLLKDLVKRMQKEIPQIKLNFIHKGKKSLRYKLKYQGKGFKYPLNIRLDFSFEKPILKVNVGKIDTKIPIAFLPIVFYLKEEELFAEKIRAFLYRGKGRDIFDIWFLFEKNIPLKKDILKKKLKDVGLGFDKEKFFKKIRDYPPKKLEKDLNKFLPKSYRRLTSLLKEKILEKKEYFDLE